MLSKPSPQSPYPEGGGGYAEQQGRSLKSPVQRPPAASMESQPPKENCARGGQICTARAHDLNILG